ncbi:MAG: energy-coupling factor transporter transmembrane protein EcfT [archaeon]|nr:energy-coupling factor transporter transmembrane protein EcfT [archaeon]
MSEETQMDTLAYSSRMLYWAPLGKLLFCVLVLIANLVTESILVPFITLAIGLSMMAYSTNFKIPFFIAIALLEALAILIIGAGLISISGESGNVLWESHFLWINIYMTDDSFNKAWLVLFRGVAGMAVMMGFATSTPIPHLSQALRQVHLPVEIVELIVLIYRYGFLLLERMEIMYHAAACRMGFNGFLRSIKTTASIGVGIFISSTNMADKAQTALSCRNYKGYFPLYRAPAKTGLKWILFSALVCAAMIIFGLETEGIVNMYELFKGVLF